VQSDGAKADVDDDVNLAVVAICVLENINQPTVANDALWERRLNFRRKGQIFVAKVAIDAIYFSPETGDFSAITIQSMKPYHHRE